MSIVYVTKTADVQFTNYYEDRADLIVWSGAVVILYGWTKKFNTSWPTKYTNSQQRAQPTDWNYRWRIRNHLNATTNLYGTKYAIEKDGSKNNFAIRYQAKNPKVAGNPWRDMYWEFRGMFPWTRNPPPDPSSVSLIDADRDAKLQFLKQVRKNYESFQGLTFLGELGETVRMLRHPMSALGKGFGDYMRTVKKRANRSSLPGLNSMISGTWLEYMYGWAPLINDIGGIGQLLNDQLERYEDSFERVYGSSEVEFEPSSWSLEYSTQNGPWIVYMKERTKTKAFVRYYGQAYRAALTGKDWTTENLGIGLRSFVPTAWELIPYSFVADYFTNTGNLIDAFSTNTSGVKWTSRDYLRIGSMETAFSRVYRNTTTQPDSTVRDYSATGALSNHILQRRYVDRVWLTEPPIVGLQDFQWKIPGMGSTKWLNLTALSTQQRETQNFLRTLTRR